MECFQPTVFGVETSFDLGQTERKRTLFRLDGGSGTDKNWRWLLARGYQLLGKGYSSRRAQALAAQVKRWDSGDYP
jgi:hypothetical protein